MTTLLLVAAVAAFMAEPTTKKVFIEPQEGGFDSYIAAAIMKKQVPVQVTKLREEADLIITNHVTEKEESTGG